MKPRRLSPRLLEVARLVADGLSYIAIGERMDVKPDTVKQFVTRACRRIGIPGSRTALAVWYEKQR